MKSEEKIEVEYVNTINIAVSASLVDRVGIDSRSPYPLCNVKKYWMVMTC